MAPVTTPLNRFEYGATSLLPQQCDRLRMRGPLTQEASQRTTLRGVVDTGHEAISKANQ